MAGELVQALRTSTAHEEVSSLGLRTHIRWFSAVNNYLQMIQFPLLTFLGTYTYVHRSPFTHTHK